MQWWEVYFNFAYLFKYKIISDFKILISELEHSTEQGQKFKIIIKFWLIYSFK